MINIDIQIKPPNRFKDFFHKIHSRLEDLLFSIIQKLPEKFIPRWLMEWLDRYTTKRIEELKHGITKDRWKSIELDRAVNNISNVQQDTGKAPSED